MLSQDEAKRVLSKLLGGRDSEHAKACTGDVETCLVDECLVCGIRDCPHQEPLHYHHDGCPACDI